MMTVERFGTKTIQGCRVTAHRQSWGDGTADCEMRYLIVRPPNAPRHWLRNVLTQIVQPIGGNGPGQFFAQHPMSIRHGQKIVVCQRMGLDI